MLLFFLASNLSMAAFSFLNPSCVLGLYSTLLAGVSAANILAAEVPGSDAGVVSGFLGGGGGVLEILSLEGIIPEVITIDYPLRKFVSTPEATI